MLKETELLGQTPQHTCPLAAENRPCTALVPVGIEVPPPTSNALLGIAFTAGKNNSEKMFKTPTILFDRAHAYRGIIGKERMMWFSNPVHCPRRSYVVAGTHSFAAFAVCRHMGILNCNSSKVNKDNVQQACEDEDGKAGFAPMPGFIFKDPFVLLIQRTAYSVDESLDHLKHLLRDSYRQHLLSHAAVRCQDCQGKTQDIHIVT